MNSYTRLLSWLLLLPSACLLLQGAVPEPSFVQQWDNNGTLWLLPYVPNATGTLAPTNWVNTGQGYNSGPDEQPNLLALDINGDGIMDLVQQWNNNGTLYLLPYIGNGTTFTATNWINTGQGYTGVNGTPGLIVIDLNGDGKSDLLQQWNNNGTLYLLPYISNGFTFTPTAWINTGNPFASGPNATPGLLVIDLNGDGKTDLVQQWNNNGALSLIAYSSNGTTFNQTNTISTGQGFNSGPTGTPGLLVTDINGDGKTDLVQQWNNNGTLYLLPFMSNGTTFVPSNWINTGQGFGSGPGGTPGLIPIDLNGDGKTDLLQQWNNNGTLYLLPFMSNGTTFVSSNWINTGNGYSSGPALTPGLIAMDLNGDGKTDLLQQWNNNGTLYFITYASTGTTFVQSSTINTGQGTNSTGDGYAGLIGGSYQDPISWNYVLAGQVLAGGSPAANITVNLSGTMTSSVTTDSDGYYEFDVQAGGNYTVTPVLSGATFSPASPSVTGLSMDREFDFSTTSIGSGGRLVPSTPAIEYIYIGGKLIAVEH